ncbi:MHYT domain-containing protein, partial [Pantoea dispersa]|nr:MHYT domain-containing protein [Pantoea dispersa]
MMVTHTASPSCPMPWCCMLPGALNCAALALGLAIAGMHYPGMAAAQFSAPGSMQHHGMGQ